MWGLSLRGRGDSGQVAPGHRRDGKWRIARLDRRTKDVDDAFDSDSESLDEFGQRIEKDGLLERYADGKVALHVHVVGKVGHGGVEDPSAYFCVGYQVVQG